MRKYSFEFKVQIVKEYLDGADVESLAVKHHIKRIQTIREWIKWYKSHGDKGLRDGRMDRSYSSTFKVQVLHWMKDNRASYEATARHFGEPTHDTIRKWQIQMDKFGLEGLLTRNRGNPEEMPKAKKEVERTDSDALKALRDENLMLKIENAYLKKLEALDRKKAAQKKLHKSSPN